MQEKKEKTLLNLTQKDNDVIVGLASYGKSTYEKESNSGIGSNGLTSARHDVLSNIYAEKYPETYSEETPEALIYCGKHLLTDKSELYGNIGKMLLSPTRTYSPIIKFVACYLKFCSSVNLMFFFIFCVQNDKLRFSIPFSCHPVFVNSFAYNI